jgi:DNA-binding LacI/PurR family transcriptional regulator
MKELQARYNADYRTVKKALGRAAAHRVIPDSGRSRRRPETTPALHNVPVFIYDHHDELSLQYLDAEVLRTIEHACRSNGLNPTFVRYRREGPSFRYINHATAMPWRPDGGELGAFWIALADNEILDDCCGRLLALNAPIAVFDSTDEQTFPAFFRNSARTAFFEAMPAGRAGEILGSLLLKLEHRRVAYVSTHFGTLWSRGNAEGLRRAFSAAGTGHSVSFVTRDLPPDDSPSATVAASLGAKATRLGRLHSRFGKKLLHSLFQRTVESATGQAFRSWLFAEGMEKLFRRALKDRGVSAWVCANDSEAIQALDFLKRHGIAVPRALSVAGISNTIDAVRFNLTSCGDDYNTIFRAMADYVVRPGVPSRDAKVRPITGFIVERGSTGPAPGYPGNRDYLAR